MLSYFSFGICAHTHTHAHRLNEWMCFLCLQVFLRMCEREWMCVMLIFRNSNVSKDFAAFFSFIFYYTVSWNNIHFSSPLHQRVASCVVVVSFCKLGTTSTFLLFDHCFPVNDANGFRRSIWLLCFSFIHFWWIDKRFSLRLITPLLFYYIIVW